MTSTPALASTAKKSFFKKPAWATQAPPAESGDFFRHSETVYDKILKEEEKRREKHAQRKEAQFDSGLKEGCRENKRRRISPDDDKEEEENGRSESDVGSAGSLTHEVKRTEPDGLEKKSRVEDRAAQLLQRSPSKSASSTKPIGSAPSQAIELGSDDEDHHSQLPAAEETAQPRRSDDDLSDEEDEYVLKLKQKAREKARLKKLGVVSTEEETTASLAAEPSQRQPTTSELPLTSAQQQPAPAPPPKKDETIVQILIMTEIADAKPLLVNRKLSQPLQQVREVWCARQNFDRDMTAKIIFTWRGNRLYDTTTSTHLLNVLKQERARHMGGFAGDDEEDPSGGRIELEALTREMYEQRQSRKNREGRSMDLKDAADQYSQEGQSVERSSTPEETKLKVVLNGQGLEAVHLRVRPSTTISTLMAAFKKKRKLDPEKTCWLVHDGERLEPDSTVGETDIEDGDAVEVHVR